MCSKVHDYAMVSGPLTHMYSKHTHRDRLDTCMDGLTHTCNTHTHTKQHYTQGHMSAYYMEGVSHRMRIMKISTSTIDLGFRFFPPSDFMGTGRWSSHIFCEISGLDCLSLCSFSHAMARHGAPWHLHVPLPPLPLSSKCGSVGSQLDANIYIYITFQVAVQVLAVLGQKIRNYHKLPYFCVNTLRFPHNLMCWWRKLRSFREYCMQWILVSKLLRLSPISTVAWFVGIHLATSMVEPQMGLESC